MVPSTDKIGETQRDYDSASLQNMPYHCDHRVSWLFFLLGFPMNSFALGAGEGKLDPDIAPT
jgi:hypothetical protein